MKVDVVGKRVAVRWVCKKKLKRVTAECAHMGGVGGIVARSVVRHAHHQAPALGKDAMNFFEERDIVHVLKDILAHHLRAGVVGVGEGRMSHIEHKIDARQSRRVYVVVPCADVLPAPDLSLLFMRYS